MQRWSTWQSRFKTRNSFAIQLFASLTGTFRSLIFYQTFFEDDLSQRPSFQIFNWTIFGDDTVCGVGAHNNNDWKLQNCSANRFLPTQQDRFVPLSSLQFCLSFKSLNDGCFRFYIGLFSVKIHHEMSCWCSCSGLCNETTMVGCEIQSHDKIP